MVNYEPWQLTSPYVGACFGHAMSKACQYVTLDDKICVGMTKVSEVSLKNAQSTLQKKKLGQKKVAKVVENGTRLVGLLA